MHGAPSQVEPGKPGPDSAGPTVSRHVGSTPGWDPRGLTPPTPLKVFISYSRRDCLDFADQLDQALKTCGFATLIDRHGIGGGQEWEKRLGEMILEADTVVFVLSPESAVSPICKWEVDEARRLSKRILPAIALSLDGARPPEHLASLNYIHFYAERSVPGSGFGSGLARLVTALNSDLDWLREHTRYLGLASAWEERGRPQSRLLTGGDIAEAKAWAARQPKTAPDPTVLQLAFLKASEDHAAAEADARQKALEERERLLKDAEAAHGEREKAIKALVALQAEQEKALAREAEALQKAQEAEQKRVAEFNLAQKVISRAQRRAGRLLAGVAALVLAMLGGVYWQARENERREALVYTELADQARKDGNFDRAMRYALQAYPAQGYSRWAPFSTQLEGKLAGAAQRTHMLRLLRGHTGAVSSVAFSPDGKRVVTASFDNTARVWDAESGKEIAVLKAHEGAALGASWSPDGLQLVTAGEDKVARIWDVSWTKVYGATLRERVCAEKLVGAAQEFNDEELSNPILSDIDRNDPVARNPCLRRGPLSLDYWTRLPGQWWRRVAG